MLESCEAICRFKQEAEKHHRNKLEKQGLARKLMKNGMVDIRIECPQQHSSHTVMSHTITTPVPVPHKGTALAYIYDGQHHGISLLTHDAQNCEFYMSPSGVWSRCKPIMPDDTGHAIESLAASYGQILQATNAVNSSLAAFAPRPMLEEHAATNAAAVVSRTKCTHLRRGLERSRSLAQVNNFLADRHSPKLFVDQK